MPISTQARVERYSRKMQRQGLITPALAVYIEGVKTKLRQTHQSLDVLRLISSMQEAYGAQNSTTQQSVYDLFTDDEIVSFFCDCFWDFLRSTLDILGQLINQHYSLHIPEKQVDFKKVVAKINQMQPNSRIDNCLKALKNSSAFKQLEDYRHCSTHRRPIYIEKRTQTTITSGTPGYSSSSDQLNIIINRYLCTNPWDVRPRVNGGRREVVTYCESLMRKIERHIDNIMNCMSR